MRAIGIDPGKKGAMCLLDGPYVELVSIPILTSSKKGTRDAYDLAGIHRQLEDWCIDGVAGDVVDCIVVVEKSQPLPAFRKGNAARGEAEQKELGGTIANFNRGEMRGWAWMLTAMKIPYELVAPRSWQKVMHRDVEGTDAKQRSIIAAQRLFPKVDLRRSERARKPDPNNCDALLLAEFGRRLKD